MHSRASAPTDPQMRQEARGGSVRVATKQRARIYLDNQATTPLDPAVREEMAPFWEEGFANPHATTYARAIDARRRVEHARGRVARAVGAPARDIVFTSGATEANNFALFGVAAASVGGKRNKIVTQATEHPSVLEPVKALGEQGFASTVVGVRTDGMVDMDALAAHIDRKTLLVSIMLVNNETGVIQPVAQVAEICRRVGALLHCDMAQALGRVPVNLRKLDVDFASISSHKSYGPQGVGALYVRRRPKARITPILFGGGQEGKLRPGTLPLALCVGFGAAAELAAKLQPGFATRANGWAEELLKRLDSLPAPPLLNTRKAPRAPGCLSLMFPGRQADALIAALPELEIATGSACHATRAGTSHVLRAMRLTRAEAQSTVRLSLGRFTTREEVRRIGDAFARALANRRNGK